MEYKSEQDELNQLATDSMLRYKKSAVKMKSKPQKLSIWILTSVDLIERQSRLEDHIGIKPASKLSDLSKEGLHRVTHPEDRYKAKPSRGTKLTKKPK